MPTLMALVASEVVVMTTLGATIDSKVGIMPPLIFFSDMVWNFFTPKLYRYQIWISCTVHGWKSLIYK